jgi:O-antigen/teichoic acid export membrane protein
VLLPVGLLAWIYAGPFLSLWIGDAGRRLDHDASLEAPLMRLFLAAAVPLMLAVPVQMAIGLNKIKVIALAALIGSLVNLPVSCYLTWRLGVSGVIWGTVLTTFVSNLLVPGLYVFRELKIDLATYLKRTAGPPLAGGAALIAATWALGLLMPVPGPGTPAGPRTTLLIAHLAAGTAAYVAGYLLVPAGRGDLAELAGRLRRR